MRICAQYFIGLYTCGYMIFPWTYCFYRLGGKKFQAVVVVSLSLDGVPFESGVIGLTWRKSKGFPVYHKMKG